MKAKINRPIISIIKQLRKFRKNLNKKCCKCSNLISQDQLKSNYHTCPECGYHFNIGGKERIDLLLKGYKIINKKFEFKNPIDFPEYEKKYMETRKKQD